MIRSSLQKSKGLRILVWHESYLAGGADWSLIDLLSHWPCEEDRFTVAVNRTHEGLSLLREKLPSSVAVRTYTSPLEMLDRLRGRRKGPRSRIAGRVQKTAALAVGAASTLRAFLAARCDLLLANNGGYPGGLSLFLAALYARIAGVGPRYMVVRNYPLCHHSESRLMRAVGGICRFALTGVVAVSENLRQSLVDLAGLPAGLVQVVYNGISLENKGGKEGKSVHGIGQDGPAVGIIGTLEERKGHRHLFAAWQQVIERFPEAKLYVVSSERSGDRPQLERLAMRLGIEASVCWMGFTSAVGDVYRRLDLVVVPSQGYESFGRVVVEAMAFETPVVACRVGGIPELLTDGREGCLVAPEDTDALARRIIELLGSPEKRREMGLCGAETYRTRFAAPIMAGKYSRLLRRAAPPPAVPA